MEYFFILLFIGLSAVFVGGGLMFSFLIAPHRPTKLKGSPYECGEEPIGRAWVQFNVGYYLFALLFLVFDVEAAFLYPWAVVLKIVGVAGLIEIANFHPCAGIGPCVCMEKGRSRMGLITDKLPGYVEHVPGGSILITSIDAIINHSRANSLWPLAFGTKCCAIEMLMATGASAPGHIAFRCGSGKTDAPAGRPDGNCRRNCKKDGAADAIALRANGRTEICYGNRFLCHLRRAVYV